MRWQYIHTAQVNLFRKKFNDSRTMNQSGFTSDLTSIPTQQQDESVVAASSAPSAASAPVIDLSRDIMANLANEPTPFGTTQSFRVFFLTGKDNLKETINQLTMLQKHLVNSCNAVKLPAKMENALPIQAGKHTYILFATNANGTMKSTTMAALRGMSMATMAKMKTDRGGHWHQYPRIIVLQPLMDGLKHFTKDIRNDFLLHVFVRDGVMFMDRACTVRAYLDSYRGISSQVPDEGGDL